MTNCSVAECAQVARKRGFCQMHYLRWWKHGDPLFVPLRSFRRPVRDRLFENVTKTASGCWEWNGGANPAGYGLIQIDNQVRSTHRVAYELTYGPVPAGLCVLHRCDNPPCIFPEHLFAGTNAENTQDMIAKGRRHKLRGESASWSKLSIEQVHLIRNSDESQKALAARMGVDRSCISNVRRRRSWAHV